MAESHSGELADKVDMQIRLAADRVLRAITTRRQAQVAVAASAALAVVSAARPDLLSSDLAAITGILQVNVIHDWLKAKANEPEHDDETLAAEAERHLPLEQIDRLLTGQHDLLRALTRQYTWQQQMLRLQKDNSDAAARLLAAFADRIADLDFIKEHIVRAATADQVKEIRELIELYVKPLLSSFYIRSYSPVNTDIDGGTNRSLLSLQDRQRLSSLIMDSDCVPYDPNARIGFMTVCGLGGLAHQMPLDARARDFVSVLVTKAELYGPISLAGPHALHVLMNYIISLPTTSPTLKQEFKKLSETYFAVRKEHDQSTNSMEDKPAINARISPELRFKVLQFFMNLGSDGVKEYGFIFGIKWSEERTDTRSRVLQLLECVQEEGRFGYLLELLKRTAPNEFDLNEAAAMA